MTSADTDLEEELRSLGVQDDDGDYDSDITPTNSPPATALHLPSDELLTNYPSSKTSGFWEDNYYGRYSQISNYSSCSDSSLSWGDDNFEGEATRQVSMLFEQLDDLLYKDNTLNAASYPAVPLLVDKRRRAAQQLKRKQSTLAEQIFASRRLLDDTEHNNALSLQIINSNTGSKSPQHLHSNSIHHQQQPLSSQKLSPQGVDNDSDDEVVWEPLSIANSESHGTSKSTKTKPSQGKKYQSKKLSTITEQLPKHVGLNKSKPLKKSIKKPGNLLKNAVLLEGVQYPDCEDDGIEVGIRELADSAERFSWPDGSHEALRTVNLSGGIYALGFAAASGQATSPLLLPTPTSPPGVPLQPTPIMKEECSYWSSRFLHLRVRGYRIDPLKLKAMESFAFGEHQKTNGQNDPSEEPPDRDVDAGMEDEGEEEVYSSDGWYTPDSSDLCLVGQYLPSVAGAAGTRKPSYDKHPHHLSLSDGLDLPVNGGDEESAPATGGDKKLGSTSGGRRVLSSSSDPEVLKEQVLVLLFDSVWPQVLNVVGGLVHRYACHLLHSAAMATSSQARTGGSASRPASGTVDYWRRPSSSSMGREGGLRRPSTTNTFTCEGAERGLHSLREERLGGQGIEQKEEDDGRLTTPLSAAPINRLHTARALMQIQRSPLSPVWSEAGNVVSLPSLELPHQRPLSSISALSLLSSSRNSAFSRNRYSSLTIELELNNSSPPTGLGGSPSPPWAKPSTTFLPPISAKGSPCLSAASSSVDVSKMISPRSREYRTPAGRRLARRNSDTMARVKKLQESRRATELPNSADYGRTTVSANSGRFAADLLGVGIRDSNLSVSTVGNKRSLSNTRLSQSVTDLTNTSRRTDISHVRRANNISPSWGGFQPRTLDPQTVVSQYSRRTRHPQPAPLPRHLPPGLAYIRRPSSSSRRRKGGGGLQRRALSVPPSPEQVFSAKQRQQEQALQHKGRWASNRSTAHKDLLDDRDVIKNKQGSAASKASTKSTRRRWDAPVAQVKAIGSSSSSGHSTPSPAP